MARSTAPATNVRGFFSRGIALRPQLRWRLVGLLVLAIIVFSQPFGLTAADTKHDLAANPLGFLRGALHAYTEVFTLGQLQNQAYGYLFPQGLFFLLTDFLPDWIAQRLWWLLVLGVGFWGFHRLLFAALPSLRQAPGWWPFLAALLYSLSPRALTTLGAISSETWPVMLAPWVVLPFLRRELNWRDAAADIIPVALMGAVNATATLAACVPAAVVLFYRRAWRPGLAWLAGCAAVSVWWIVPLLVLGRYAPPFTEFIESSFVTTRWLNLPEILRGTTSWAPFVDTERSAGYALAIEPVFVLVTIAVAAVGLYGLTRLPRVWPVMLCVGIAILGTHAAWYLHALDGPLAALRNLHKFDPLVRIPLLLGFAAATAALPLPRGRTEWLRPGRRQAMAVLVAALACASFSPAWTGRLLPKGAYSAVPDYWHEAADFLNATARDTRTLLFPESSFARQDWGWTRDEPAQALLDVPWAVRDAIPLVPPEAIRGLDGIVAALHDDPRTGTAALQRQGIGAILLRHDLASTEGASGRDDSQLAAWRNASSYGGQVHAFGPNDEVEVIILPHQDSAGALSTTEPVRVAGGGESLAFLDAHSANRPAYELVEGNADIVTDTPTLSDRNYGTLDGPISAPLGAEDPSTVNNRLRDYPSTGPLTTVESHGGTVRASSSAADADSFGGANPARSITSAVDGENSTAWWPAPGDTGWLELNKGPQTPAWDAPVIDLMATGHTEVTVRSGSAKVKVKLKPYRSRQVRVPGGATHSIRIELKERVGIANAQVMGSPIERVVTVPDTSPDVRQFFFQQLLQDSRILIRDFTAPRSMQVTLDSTKTVLVDGARYNPGDTLTLRPGKHRVRTTGTWISLREKGWNPPSTTPATGRDITAASTERLLITGNAFNEGLRGHLDSPTGSVDLQPREIDAGGQAYVIPAGASGSFRQSFVAERTYQVALGLGGALALLTVAGCLLALRRRPHEPWLPADTASSHTVAALCGLGTLALLGLPAVLAGVAAWAVLRWTSLSAAPLAASLTLAAGAMLARAPWASGTYAGDSVLVTCLCAAALACVLWPRNNRRPGSSTTA